MVLFRIYPRNIIFYPQLFISIKNSLFFLRRSIAFSRNIPNGLSWWLSGKESACQFRRHRFNPWSRKIPHATDQLTHVPQLLSLCSGAREATAMKSLLTTTREKPHSNKDPVQPKIDILKKKKHSYLAEI